MKKNIFSKRAICAFFLFVYAIAATYAGDVVKILAIGNSFSRDAIEQNLWELADADGQEVVIGNMYIPGCPIDLHAENAKSDACTYEFVKINKEGKKTRKDSVSLDYALRNENWDIVTVQQASYSSGQYESYARLSELIEYVRMRVHYNTKILFHETWAYAANSTHQGFKRYGNDQLTMYKAIAKCAEQAVADNGLQGVIPSGDAIQAARATSLGDNLNIDGHHLNEKGKYIAACTWYETIFGRDVRKNTYRNAALTPKEQKKAQKAAHKAARQRICGF